MGTLMWHQIKKNTTIKTKKNNAINTNTSSTNALLLLVVSSIIIQGINSFTVCHKHHQQQKQHSSIITLLNQQQPSYGLYEVQEELITKRAIYEETLMKDKYDGPIQTNKLKGVGSGGGGFGGGKANASALRAQGKGYAKILKKDGVIRIDNILSKEECDIISSFVTELRAQSDDDDDNNNNNGAFAEVLLRKNRCDLTMPINDITINALNTILNESTIGATIESILGKKALLYEFSCLMSDYGSNRQNIHPDTPVYNNDNSIPVLYTCFIALQDVDIDMGPTLWMPNTHTLDVHTAFQQEEQSSSNNNESLSPKDQLLKTKPHVLGTLPAGSCGIFDSRLLHCGTSNKKPDSCRKVFYVSFQNPKIGYPGNPPSIRPELKQMKDKLSLDILKKELTAYCNPKKKGKVDNYPLIDTLMNSMK